MKDDYAQDVEKQNEVLRAIVEETTKKLEHFEKLVTNFDYLPTFVINHNEKSPIPNYRHFPFIHQCLESAYEVTSDFVGDDILSHVERENNKPKPRRKPEKVGVIDFQCWYLGSLERTYHICIWSPTSVKGMDKYNISLNQENPAGIAPTWDLSEDQLYQSKIPSIPVLRHRIIEDLLDCKVTHKYILDK